MKDVVFMGSALEDLRAFPPNARGEAGYQIDLLQQGLDPSDWKPINAVGAGVREIRIHEAGEHRVLICCQLRGSSLCLACVPEENTEDSKAGY